MITRLCILAGVHGVWAEEEICPKVSPLTLTGVLKGPKNKKRKEMEIVEVTKRPDEEENEELGMRQIPEESQLPTRRRCRTEEAQSFIHLLM